MLLSNPSFEAKTVTSPVETMQVAPTILKALALDPIPCRLCKRKALRFCLAFRSSRSVVNPN
jgi:hypothetical protein